MIVTKIFKFDSAHKLNNYKGNCKNLHGHTYILHVSIKGKVDHTGFVIDFKDLKKIVKEEIISKLDHAFINDIIKQPTAENICMWIWEKLSEKLNLHEIKLYETHDSYVIYKGEKNEGQ